jgi:hypothetical protein
MAGCRGKHAELISDWAVGFIDLLGQKDCHSLFRSSSRIVRT